jgi:hypothetical protein
MFSAQMPSAPWTAADEGRGRRAGGLGGGWPGAYRRGAPHSQRARTSSPVSFAREARLNVRPIRAFCGPQSSVLVWARTALGAAGESVKASGYG